VLDKEISWTDLTRGAQGDELLRQQNMFGLIRQMEFLETMNCNGAFGDTEEAYEAQCDRLLRQYETMKRGFPGGFDFDNFTKQHDISVNLARRRVEVGLNANEEHRQGAKKQLDTGKAVSNISEVIQLGGDIQNLVQLNLLTGSELLPNITQLKQNFVQLPLPADFARRATVDHWMARAQAMRPEEGLDEAESSKLQMDMQAIIDEVKLYFSTRGLH